MDLITPTALHLPAYRDALRRGWSPDDLRPEAAQEELDRIAQDPDAFLRSFDQREPRDLLDAEVTLPDGSRVPRLPGIKRFIWQDGFCGTIGLRWQVGAEALPPTCLGHIGYAVVPWRRREGLATAALRAILPEAQAAGLRHVEITTSPDNGASIGVIRKAGGALVERFTAAPAVGGGDHMRFRIHL